MRFLDASIFLYALVPFLTVMAGVQYLSLRIRNTRQAPPDPQIGRKYAIGFFLHLSIMLVLSGLTVSALEMAEYLFEPAVEAQQARLEAERARERADPDFVPLPANQLAALKPPRVWFNETQRVAAGLAGSGAIHILVFWPLLRFGTNARHFPAVGRSFVGVRLIVSVLVLMTLSTVTLIAVLKKGETDLANASVIAGLVAVWGPSALIHLGVLMLSKRWHKGREDREE